KHAVELFSQALPEPQWQLVVEGAAQLANQPEFDSVERLRVLVQAIEDKTLLLSLLEQLFDRQQVQVILGSDHQITATHKLACVGAGFSSPGGTNVAIGLVGPNRMDYGRLVPLVG